MGQAQRRPTSHSILSKTYNNDQLGYTNYNYQNDPTYAYDDNGNRTYADGKACTVGAGNRLSFDGTYHYAYDAEGNRRFKFKSADGTFGPGDTDITVYVWDYRNRLTSEKHFANYTDSTPDKEINYSYDIFNHLVGKTLDSNGDAVVDRREAYVYDGENLVLKFARNDGGALAASDLKARYLTGMAVDQVFAEERVTSLGSPGNVLWMFTDNQGTVRDVADFNAGTTAVVDHLTYDSFGKISSQTNSANAPTFSYTGRLYDADAGLYYYRARWYDAGTGGFISEDPLGFAARDPNLYRYGVNGPTNASDPSGLESVASENGLCCGNQPANYAAPSDPQAGAGNNGGLGGNLGNFISGGGSSGGGGSGGSGARLTDGIHCNPPPLHKLPGGLKPGMHPHSPSKEPTRPQYPDRPHPHHRGEPSAAPYAPAKPSPVRRSYSPVPPLIATTIETKIYNRYIFWTKRGLSDNTLVEYVIIDSLIITNGNAKLAFGAVQNLRNHNPSRDNDVWASIDHFYQSWSESRDGMLKVPEFVPFIGGHEQPFYIPATGGFGSGFLGSLVATVKNDGYAIKKVFWGVTPDNPCNPPSPFTWMQYFWGSKGTGAALWYNNNLEIGSPEWKSFIDWLNKVSDELYF